MHGQFTALRIDGGNFFVIGMPQNTGIRNVSGHRRRIGTRFAVDTDILFTGNGKRKRVIPNFHVEGGADSGIIGRNRRNAHGSVRLWCQHAVWVNRCDFLAVDRPRKCLVGNLF